jgi:hypothetical protein
MGALQVILLILLGAVSLGVLATALALWLAGRCFRIEGASWRRALVASLILMLLNAGLCAAALQLEHRPSRPSATASGAGAGIAAVVLISCILALLFVKLTLRVTFRRAILPSVAFCGLYATFSAAIIFPVRWWLAEAFEIPTQAMAPTLLGHHTTIPCNGCGAVLALGIRTDPGGRPTWGREEQAACSRCGGSVELPPEISLLSGDRILVDKMSGPARWDLFTFRSPMDRETIYVKRLVGLPGERVEIASGEVFTDGKLQKKAPGSAEELWIPVHEDEGAVSLGKPAGGSGWKPEREPSSWRRNASGWAFDGADEEKLVFQGRITDWMEYNSLYLRTDHRFARPVGDVQVALVLERWDGTGSLEFEWEHGEKGVKGLVNADGGAELKSDGGAATGTVGSALSGGSSLAFSVRDGLAYLSTGEKVICSLDFDAPTVEASRAPHGDPPLRLAIGARRSRLEIRRLAVRRDIYYREDSGGSRFAGTTLKAGEYFVLGDNPMSSADSRTWGPVPASNLHGVVRWIFWPPERITGLPRRLGSD